MYLVKVQLSLLVKMYLCLHNYIAYVEPRTLSLDFAQLTIPDLPDTEFLVCSDHQNRFSDKNWCTFKNSRDLLGQESESINFHQIY
jgi:hypothetical protein